MNTLAPVSVTLKFGFLVVLYLFLLWIARSARRDLHAGAGGVGVQSHGGEWAPGPAAGESIPPDATGMYSASAIASADFAHRAPRLVIDRAPGHDPGMIYDLDGDLVLGRGDSAEIRLEDPYASSRHARVYEQGNTVVIEDLGSTNGTYLNEELLESPRPLYPGDRLRIGDSEFTFEVD
ncbi:MAG TPA: FHA domain-containing protein [Solirubrobacteraceae bacterium]|nr:FHA domain-containing protein [Solirubrobacteraceae bacterium]